MKIFTFFSLLFCVLVSNAQQFSLIQFSTGYNAPVGIENCGDSRLFIVEEEGKIFICDASGNRIAKPFLDITDRVLFSGEQGLLGLAFDPNYAVNRFFYVNYINKNGNTQISRFTARAGYPNEANKQSEKFILEIDQPFSNHNGGCTRFGPDGYLYIGMGDGGSGGDPNNNAQNPMSLLGKMLRLNVHSGSLPYTIPADNPFVDSPNYRHEIWALGYRNPWRWSFDALNGKMHIADVGQETWEEIDIEPAGKGGFNYGWRCYEGFNAYNTTGCKAQSAYRSPIYQYQHGGNGGDCSVTGGFVYRGSRYNALYNKYVFTDYCTGVFRLLSYSNGTVKVQNVFDGDNGAYSSFGEDKNHELFVCNLVTGNIYRVAYGRASLNDAVAENSFGQNTLAISPNPAKNYVNVVYTSAVAARVMVHVSNLLGENVYDGTQTINAGTNSFKININVPKGNYYLSVVTNDGKILTRSLRIE